MRSTPLNPAWKAVRNESEKVAWWNLLWFSHNDLDAHYAMVILQELEGKY